MSDLRAKDYVVIVQCHIVKERCSGYACEKFYRERIGGFAEYPKDRQYRMIFMTCGGCCGKALHRKLAHLARKLKKLEGKGRDKIIVQLSTCMTKSNHHGPPNTSCPSYNYYYESFKNNVSPHPGVDPNYGGS